MRVLFVEDHDRFASALIDALTAHGHQITWCRRGEDALLAHRHEDAELVLLDLGLPGIDGFEVLCRLREVSEIPVIVITGYGEDRLQVRAFECGANDHIVKPIRLPVLLARMKAAVRPSRDREGPSRPLVRVEDVRVDLDARTVEVAGEPVAFTTKEFEILAVLARHAGTPVRRRAIMDKVWGDGGVQRSRALDVHIANLRAKLGRPGLIENVHGYGYRFG